MAEGPDSAECDRFGKEQSSLSETVVLRMGGRPSSGFCDVIWARSLRSIWGYQQEALTFFQKALRIA